MIFSIHNWISTKCVPLDILNLRSFYFGLPGNDCTKGTHHKKNEQKHEAVGRLRRPTSCAASVLKYSHFLLGQHKIYTSRVYLTSHVFRSPVMRLFPDQKPDCYYLTALSSTFWRSGCSSYTICYMQHAGHIYWMTAPTTLKAESAGMSVRRPGNDLGSLRVH